MFDSGFKRICVLQIPRYFSVIKLLFQSSINEEAIKKAEAEWEREIELISDSPTEGGNPCDLKFTCDEDKEYSFRIISGAANVIGPRICWNGKDIMRSKVLHLFDILGKL